MPAAASACRSASAGPGQCFKGRQFTAEVILWAVRWYLMFPISYRDLELMLADRVEVDRTTIFRWIQAYAPEIEKRIRPHLCPSNGSWRVDETYVRVKGRWTYLYRAVDKDLAGFDFASSQLNEALVRQLHAGAFVEKADNIVLVGGPGTGKTHVATALGIQAVERHRKRVRFFSTVELVNALEQEKAAGKAGRSPPAYSTPTC
jgi:DNA replication protein DnaC